MLISSAYRQQVELLLDVLPIVARRKCFALKGGTALNLFIWNMPRLSVDIDLVYLPINSRDEAFEDISNNLVVIKDELEKEQDLRVILTNNSKLICYNKEANVKIEVNTTIRGSIFEPKVLEIVDKVQDHFGRFASISVLNKNEIYGGKICAALDRQHPRDLFDISKIIDESNGKLDDYIKNAFIFYLLSHNRPINELLSSNINDNQDTFDSQFAGMTEEKFSYDDFIDVSKILRKQIKLLFNDDDKKFILSFKKGNPDWSLFVKDISKYPSIKWKLENIQKLLKLNPKKGDKMFRKLEAVL